VLLTVYANCVDGQESVADARIADALKVAPETPGDRATLTTGSAPAGSPASHPRAKRADACWVRGCSRRSGGLA
jgi:hypothetical protein